MYIVIVNYKTDTTTDKCYWFYAEDKQFVEYWKVQCAMNVAINEMIVVEEDKIMGQLIKLAKKNAYHYYKNEEK